MSGTKFCKIVVLFCFKIEPYILLAIKLENTKSLFLKLITNLKLSPGCLKDFSKKCDFFQWTWTDLIEKMQKSLSHMVLMWHTMVFPQICQPQALKLMRMSGFKFMIFLFKIWLLFICLLGFVFLNFIWNQGN